MTQYVHLIGTEEVQRAASSMQEAAGQMSTAAGSFSESVRAMDRIAERIELALERFAERIETAAKGNHETTPRTVE